MGLVDVLVSADSPGELKDVYEVTELMDTELGQIINSRQVPSPCSTARTTPAAARALWPAPRDHIGDVGLTYCAPRDHIGVYHTDVISTLTYCAPRRT